MWFTVSAVASGGLAGVFLLAFLSSRTSRRGVYAGIVANLIFTLWASLTLKEKPLVNLGAYNFPWHDYMIGAVGNIILMSVGYTTSLLLPLGEDGDSKLREMTIWHWLKSRKQSPAGVAEPA
jgi:SSS family solute:Na+ symporter